MTFLLVCPAEILSFLEKPTLQSEIDGLIIFYFRFVQIGQSH